MEDFTARWVDVPVGGRPCTLHPDMINKAQIGDPLERCCAPDEAARTRVLACGVLLFRLPVHRVGLGADPGQT